MRKTLCIVGLALAVRAVSSAQDVPRVEVFGGYSYGAIRAYLADESLPGGGPGVVFPRFGSNGWTGSAAVNATPWFGVIADVSGLSATPTRMIGGTPVNIDMQEHSYLFGPRFSYRRGRWTLFAHGLIGEAHASVAIAVPEVLTPLSIVDTRLAMSAGTGVDITAFSRHRHPKGAGEELAIRIGQIDWLRTYFVGSRQNNVRFSAGLVFRF